MLVAIQMLPSRACIPHQSVFDESPSGFPYVVNVPIAQLQQAAIEQPCPQVVFAVLKERLDRVAGQAVLRAIKAQGSVMQARQSAALESDPEIAIVVEEQRVDVVPFESSR